MSESEEDGEEEAEEAAGPVGRPAALGVYVLNGADFWQRMRQEVNGASYGDAHVR
jgi:hypothetical protein